MSMMKKTLGSLLVLASSTAVTSVAADVVFFDEFCPRVGIDYRHTWMRGADSFKKFTPRSYPGGTIYFGAKFNPYWGVDAGYTLLSATRKHTFNANDNLPARSGTMKTTATLQGPHIDVSGYFPVDDCLNLFAKIGVAFYQPRFKMTVANLNNDAALTSRTQANVDAIRTRFTPVLRLGFGGEYMATEMVGLRLGIGYELTSQVKVKEHDSTKYNTRIFDNAVSATAGAFVKF